MNQQQRSDNPAAGYDGRNPEPPYAPSADQPRASGGTDDGAALVPAFEVQPPRQPACMYLGSEDPTRPNRATVADLRAAAEAAGYSLNRNDRHDYDEMHADWCGMRLQRDAATERAVVAERKLRGARQCSAMRRDTLLELGRRLDRAHRTLTGLGHRLRAHRVAVAVVSEERARLAAWEPIVRAAVMRAEAKTLGEQGNAHIAICTQVRACPPDKLPDGAPDADTVACLLHNCETKDCPPDGSCNGAAWVGYEAPEQHPTPQSPWPEQPPGAVDWVLKVLHADGSMASIRAAEWLTAAHAPALVLADGRGDAEVLQENAEWVRNSGPHSGMKTTRAVSALARASVVERGPVVEYIRQTRRFHDHAVDVCGCFWCIAWRALDPELRRLAEEPDRG